MKKTRQWSEKDLTQLDAWEFARFGGKVQASSSVQQFPRLLNELHDQAKADPGSLVVQWVVYGEMNAAGHCFIGLEGAFSASIPCMRCSQPVSGRFDFKRLLRLCKSDQEADTADLDEDIDPVVASGKVNAIEWLEDELMLSLPMFPSHEDCMDEIEDAADEEESSEFSGESETSDVLAHESSDASVVQAVNDANEVSSEKSNPVGVSETHRPFEILARLKKPGSV